MNNNITVIILTYNEALNIRQALNNVLNWANDVIILDSNSDDETVRIATEEFGVKIYIRDFDNYKNQRNYAINDLPIKNDWIFFLDADEFLTEELKTEINNTLNNTDCDGFLIKRRFYFMGKWIKYGGYYPTWLLRLFKKDKAQCEREINEHIHVNGKVGKLKFDFVDFNHKDFTNWLDKHNKYASFEAQQLLKSPSTNPSLFRSQAENKAWIRENIWKKIMPPIFRPFLYFFYRYIIMLGFLDGKIGFIYHFMQGLVFHMLIDIKFIEAKLIKKKSSPPVLNKLL